MLLYSLASYDEATLVQTRKTRETVLTIVVSFAIERTRRGEKGKGRKGEEKRTSHPLTSFMISFSLANAACSLR
jgi:hypothetical protein